MTVVYNYTLAYNVSGAINADYPVGYTLTIAFLTFAFALYHYMFITKTFAGFFGENSRCSLSTKSTKGVDIYMFGLFLNWFGLPVMLISWAFAQYYPTFYAYATPDGNTPTTLPYTIPQEYTNIVLFGLCFGQSIIYHGVLLWNSNKVANGDFEIGVRAERVLTWTPAIIQAAICLFLGAYSFLQSLGTQSYCNNAACWSYSAGYYSVAQMTVATGVCLATSLLVYTQRNSRDKLKSASISSDKGPNVEIDRGSKENADVTIAGVQEGLMHAAMASSLHHPVMYGWVPTFYLPFWWIVAYCFFIPTSVLIIYHDIVKGAMAFAWWIMVPVTLTLLAQDTSYFYPYHIACVFWSITIVYFASAVVQPVLVAQALASDQLVVDWGAFLTGPDTNSNVNADAFTVNLLVWGTFVIAGLHTFFTLTRRKTSGNEIAEARKDKL
jgi:hypothetical protein